MAKDTIVTGSKLTAIANAIRTRGGTQAQLTLDQMPQAVADIPSGFDFSQCTGIMFTGGLIAGAPDLSSMDTSSFTTMDRMFSNCSGLTALDVSGFDTSNVTTFNYMFSGCSGLTALDVSGFDTSNVTNLASMFRNCSGLTSIDLSGFDTSDVTGFASMFQGCSGLTSLDLSSFDTLNGAGFSAMFRDMTQLTSVNLSSFDTSSATNMTYMFYNDSVLTDIIWSQKSTVQRMESIPETVGITSQMKFYVPDALVSSYKAATNWSTIASQIYPISQIPASVAALYGIGD